MLLIVNFTMFFLVFTVCVDAIPVLCSKHGTSLIKKRDPRMAGLVKPYFQKTHTYINVICSGAVSKYMLS